MRGAIAKLIVGAAVSSKPPYRFCGNGRHTGGAAVSSKPPYRVSGLKTIALIVLFGLGSCDLGASVAPGNPDTIPTAKVVAAQVAVREPWDGFVDIDFTVYLPLSGTMASIGVTAVDAGRAFTASTLSGATSVSSSGVYRVSWNFAADYPDVYAPALEVEVNAVVAAFTPDAHSGEYMVVDLTGGVEASDYPVNYLMEVPSGGWTDEYKTSKLVLRKLPAGSFVMGQRHEEYPKSQDQNLHEVVFTNAVWAGVFEVTQRQWELVKGNRPSFSQKEECYMTRPVESVNYAAIRGNSAGKGWPASSAVDDDSFLGVLRERTGDASFDLPTEAQWEYACRAGTTTGLNSGVNLTNRTVDASLDVLARYGCNGAEVSKNDGLDSGTAAVGTYVPNAWGLYDMHGNVWEWCRDWYQGNLGTTSVTNPPGPASNPSGYRVLRGGGWDVEAFSCAAGYRGNTKSPTVTSGARVLGFRVFAEVPTAPLWDGPTEGSGMAAPVNYDGRIIVTLPEALDAPAMVFTTGGDNGAEWVATNAQIKTGTHSAQCLSPGTATRGEGTRTVWMETVVEGAGTLTFWWKVDCDKDYETGECGWDHLAYFVDGVEQMRIDGDTDWTHCTVTLVGDGVHTIRWAYVKDAYRDERECADVGWVDEVVWTPAGSQELKATIRVENGGQVLVGWEPHVAGEATLLAKRKLDDEEEAWQPVAVSNDGSDLVAPAGYRFFKVSVRF